MGGCVVVGGDADAVAAVDAFVKGVGADVDGLMEVRELEVGNLNVNPTPQTLGTLQSKPVWAPTGTGSWTCAIWRWVPSTLNPNP
jgi:hypothetical protein